MKYQLKFFYFLSYVFSDQFSSICFIVHILSFLKLFILTFAFLFFHCFSYAAIHITACSNQSCFNNIFKSKQRINFSSSQSCSYPEKWIHFPKPTLASAWNSTIYLPFSLPIFASIFHYRHAILRTAFQHSIDYTD